MVREKRSVLSRLWPRRLWSQMIWLVTLIMLVTVLVYSWHVSTEVREDSARIMRQHATAVSGQLAHIVGHHLLDNDQHALEETFEDMLVNSDIVELYLTDLTGKVQLGAGYTAAGAPLLIRERKQLSPPVTLTATNRVMDGRMQIWLPVITPGVPTQGWLQVTYRYDVPATMATATFMDSIQDGLLMLLAAVALTVAVMYRPMRSLREAGQFAENLDQWRGRQLPVTRGAYEIERLFVSLNHASAKLYRQEAALHDIQQRLIRAQRVARLGLWEWDEAQQTLYWTDEDYDIQHRRTRNFQVAIRAYLINTVHPEDRRMVSSVVAAALAARRSVSLDHRIIQADGTVRSVHHQVEVTTTEAGGLVRVLGTVQDITARKQAENETRRKGKQVMLILESTTDGYLSVGNDLVIEYVNNQAEKIFGLSRQVLQGQPLWEGLPELADAFYSVFHSAMVEGKHLSAVGFYAPAALWLEAHAYPHKGGMSIYFRDVTESRRAIEALRQSEAKVRAILENVIEAIITIDQHGTIVTFNKAAETTFGYPASEVLGQNVSMLMPDEYAARHDAHIKHYLDTPRLRAAGVSRELNGRRKDGSEFPLEINLSEMKVGQESMFIGIVRDITQRKQTEAHMRLSEEVFANSVEGIVVLDEAGNIVRVNKAFSRITGHDVADVVGRDVGMIGCSNHENGVLGNMWQLAREAGQWEGEFWCRRKNGEFYLNRMTVSAIVDDMGNLRHLVGIFSDVTEIKEARDRIHHLAHFDALTDLPNRSMFKDYLQQALMLAVQKQERVAVIYLNLDRFKNLNDTLGHASGDELLKIAATRIQARIRAGDIVARLSGDEFVIMVTGIGGVGDVESVCRHILGVFEQPISLDGHEIVITASMGVAVFPEDAENADDLLKHAGTAMHFVKEHGRNAYQRYTQELDAASFEKLVMENSLRRALERQEFVLFYQPQVDLRSGHVIGVEALIRWQHPDLGMVSPAKFIPLLEETGLILPVGEWVLQEACRQARSWVDAGFGAVRMAVNLSPRQFEQRDLMRIVRHAVESTRLEPGQLELEITESSLMGNAEQSVAMLREMREMDIHFSIDDFGTGYSSLSYLTKFPIDTLKIDRSFVKDVMVDRDDATLATAIISMGHALNLKVLAEGVERYDQLAFLRQHACDEVQGYLFSPPVPAPQVVELFERPLPLAPESPLRH